MGGSFRHGGAATGDVPGMTMVLDHDIVIAMETMAISKFNATCLATLERVRRTGQPVRVTRFGKPVADIVAPAPEAPPKDWLGSLRGTLEIRGDIVSPSSELVEWEANR
jgi:antitoxin (DNA-binding transcriptional repressor) of toxin-antitoxin stability system